MISLIRDYLDILSSTLNTSTNYFEVLQVTLKFCIESLLGCCQYLLTFGWFRDLMYLPIVLPKCQGNLLSGRFFYEDLNLTFFSNFSTNAGIGNFFALGFVNSLFCCLPFSTTHLFAVRRLFVQGMLAGATSTLGIIVGQCAFIFCTIFGIRWAIIPWLSLEPLSYMLGIYLTLSMVYEMVNEKGMPDLRKVFFLSAVLTWTEETTISQYLTNLTFSHHPSILTVGGTGNFATNFSYFFGIVLGHLFFSACFIGLTLAIKNALVSLSKLPYSTWVKRVNNLFLIAIIAFSLSSIPYYSLDYLITGPLGFVSQDAILENSIFSQKNAKDPSRLLTSVDVVFPFSIDTDISYFDRGDYGDQPGFFKRNFEQLNYQGEYAWIVRRDKKPNLYSSGQTTETTIRDLFNLKTSTLNSSEEEQQQQELKQKEGQDTSGNIRDQAEERLLAKNIRTTDRDLLKLRKRFAENYEETRFRDNYLIGESFNTIPQIDMASTPLELALKLKFYTNLVYKTLLNIEIDSFLKRQPSTFSLNEQEEKDVYKKRLALARYYDTIRAYQQIPYKDEFQNLFQGSKTFVDRAYHHQFKGTLGVVRRLFAVTLDNDENPSQKSVLKLDQPLNLNQTNLFAHEELTNQLQRRNLTPFLETNDSTPFYLGWDNEQRKMVLTKRFNPNSNSIPINQNIQNNRQFRNNLNKIDQDNQKNVIFTTWPLQKKPLMEIKAKPTNSIVTLFEPTSNPEVMAIYKLGAKAKNDENVQVFCFPANIRYLNKIPEHLVPNQGGFVWPGTQYKQAKTN